MDVGLPFAHEPARQWLESSGALVGEEALRGTRDSRKGDGGGDDAAESQHSGAAGSEDGDLGEAERAAGRPPGINSQKKRKAGASSAHALADAVKSIAQSEKRRLETQRRENIALMQSDDVPQDMRR